MNTKLLLFLMLTLLLAACSKTPKLEAGQFVIYCYSRYCREAQVTSVEDNDLVNIGIYPGPGDHAKSAQVNRAVVIPILDYLAVQSSAVKVGDTVFLKCVKHDKETVYWIRAHVIGIENSKIRATIECCPIGADGALMSGTEARQLRKACDITDASSGSILFDPQSLWVVVITAAQAEALEKHLEDH